MTVMNRNRRPMIFGNKKRPIEILQCSGDDMSIVLTSAFNNMVPLTSGLASMVPQMPVASLPSMSVASMPPVPMTLQQRPMISPSGMSTSVLCSAMGVGM